MLAEAGPPPRRAEQCGVLQRTVEHLSGQDQQGAGQGRGPPRDASTSPTRSSWTACQKVRRSVADVATARKRIELQAAQLQKQADKLQDQAKAALTQGNEDLAREALSRRAALGEQLADLKTQHDQVTEQEEKLVADLPAPPGPGRAVPHPEGDPEGQLHRGRGPDQGRRGRLGDLDVHGRRRRGHAAGPGQDRRHAGPGRRHRRAAGLGGPDRPRPPRSTTSRPSWTRCRPAPRSTTSWPP